MYPKMENTEFIWQKMAMGLEFKMGSEILRTVVVREWKEIGLVAGIIALRAALTFLIHWEIKQEELRKRQNKRGVSSYGKKKTDEKI